MSTTVSSVDVATFKTLRRLCARMMELSGGLEWRRHGIGVLQAYLFEGTNEEVRLHIWSPKLWLPGIDVSGDIHDHRFKLTSTVLVGNMLHEPMEVEPAYNGTHETYDFVHARLQTEETRADMRPTGERFNVQSYRFFIDAGERYTFTRGKFHRSWPTTDLCVTLCTKTEQIETKARVLAPVGVPPVPAFGGDAPDSALVAHLIHETYVRLSQ